MIYIPKDNYIPSFNVDKILNELFNCLLEFTKDFCKSNK